jgi:hypothetical protein
MKEVLRFQGLFDSAACREPQLGVGAAEREAISELCRRQGVEGR